MLRFARARIGQALMSLRLRFLLATMAITGSALTGIALFSSRAAHSGVEGAASSPPRVPSVDRNAIHAALMDYWNRHHGWASVELTLHRLAGEAAGLLLLSSQGATLSAWPPELADSRVTRHPDESIEIDFRTPAGEQRRTILRGPPRIDLPEATLFVLPVPAADSVIPTANRSLFYAAGFAFAAAMLSGLLLSRYILHPVGALAIAASEVAEGRFDRRVPARGGDEIARLANCFNTMADRLAHSEQFRRNMIGDISNELRTPLARMQRQVEAIQDGLAPSTPEALRQLHDQILHLDRLVDDLQDLSLADAGQLKLTLLPVPIDAFVREFAEGLPVELVLAPNLPPVLADQRRLRQILESLVSHALRHSPEGTPIRIAAEHHPREIEVRVQDRGAGIPPEQLALVFDRFHRADDSRERSTGGTGLGLAIVKHLVEAHGGRVRAESSAGEGATLIFTLPTIA